MALPRMFKVPSHSKFDYQPLYYDEKKEKMKKRLEKYNTSVEDKGTDAEFNTDIKGKFRSNKNLSSSYSSQKRISNIRLLIIIGFIGITMFYILQNQGVISYMFNILFEK